MDENSQKVNIQIDRKIIEERLLKKLSNEQWRDIKNGLEGQYNLLYELSWLLRRVDII